ncbi:CYFA0S05e04742g1_1 [Cyberlindnera fabianii]|uniref:CYFA0S05e04742g1_1 n=1 Tax=Cyberlindnera fabianii TaxID=36022 RepID=A0A061AZI1_CYBFA|nr:CYFA0S05e04742g1_1 [Cyberlindnera fabianii]
MLSLRVLRTSTFASPMTLRSVVATRGLSSSSVGRLASSPTIFNQHNNRDEIDKLNELIKVKLAQLEEDEKRRIIEESKPKLSDFQRPILLTLVIASTAYLAFHWAWWYLEYDEREKELKGMSLCLSTQTTTKTNQY